MYLGYPLQVERSKQQRGQDHIQCKPRSHSMGSNDSPPVPFLRLRPSILARGNLYINLRQGDPMAKVLGWLYAYMRTIHGPSLLVQGQLTTNRG